MSDLIVHLCGPTACGKSAIAEALCTEFDAELISVDSAQVYRGLDIGSAKPDAAAQTRFRYHLLDLLEPEQSYSAARFVIDAQQASAEIRARGRLPILVGGTMLYFKALNQGLSELPDADPAVRERLLLQMQSQGLDALHAQLAGVDQAAAARIHRHDAQRVLRALEVYEVTGVSLSSLQQRWQQQRSPADNVLRFGIFPADRHVLHGRIAERFEQMLDTGFLAEVAALQTRPQLTLEHPSMRCVGYRQAWQYLAANGTQPLENLRQTAIAATRQLAKRQFTWMRSDPELLLLDGAQSQILDTMRRRIAARMQ